MKLLQSSVSLLTILLVSAAARPESLEEFGRHVETMYLQNDMAGLKSAWNNDRLFDLISQNIQADQSFKNDFKAGASMIAESLYGKLLKDQGVSGSYRYLHNITREGKERLLFRTVSGQGLLNYHEIITESDAQGKLRIVDMYILVSGETLSQTMRRIYVQGAMSRETSRDEVFNAYQASQQAFNSGDYQKVLDLFNKLTPALKKDKILSLNRLRAAMRVSDEIYEKVITEHQAQFGKDTTVDLMNIDLYSIKKDWKKTHEVIDRLDESLGKDPYLNVLRANVYAAMGDRTKVVPLAEKALKQEATLIPAAEIILGDTLSRRDHPATLKIMLQMERDMNYRFGEIDKLQIFNEFAQSEEAVQFQQQRPK